MSVRIPVTSKQYYEVPLTSPNIPDPTTLPVLWAFSPTLAPPAPSTVGNWVTRTENGEVVHYARILVGGTGTGATVELDPGVWHAWAKVDGATEDPVMRTGVLVIQDVDTSGIIPTDTSGVEFVQDTVGGMVTGNTETGIAVTYDDTDGTLDFITEVTQAELDAVAASAAPRTLFSVKDYGALGNGVADDTTAITNAANALHTAGGGVLYFPRGTYRISGSGFLLRASNMVVRGDGNRASVIAGVAAGVSQLFASSPSLLRENLAFEDVGFDLANVTTTGVSVSGSYIRGHTRFSRCRFWSGGSAAYGIRCTLTSNVTIDGCEFGGTGNGAGSGISLTDGCRAVTIRDNRFRYLANGISVDTGTTTSQTERVTQDLVLSGNYFDMGWWLLRHQFSGSGGTVTYTGTVLTDTGAAFGTLGTNTNIRVMPELESGSTGTTYSRSSLVDSTATFLTAGVKRGHIVRAGGVFAVVTNAESETTLWVEEWLSDTDRLPVDPPATATAYSVYGVYLGRRSANTATTITVPVWYDLDGATVTPSAGTRYEVMYGPPNYNFNCEYATRNLRVVNNTFKRGWSDQCSIFGYQAQIIGNTFEDGQDLGLTLHGQYNVVSGNRFFHNGQGGHYLDADDSVVTGNVFHDNWWDNHVNVLTASQLLLWDSVRCLVANNSFRRTSSLAMFGIAVANNSTDNVLRGNVFNGHTTGGIKFHGPGSGATGTVLRTSGDFTDSSAINVTSGTEPPRGTFVGTGTPEGSLLALVGSTYRRTDGGTGTSLYVKETGTGAIGWVAVAAGGGGGSAVAGLYGNAADGDVTISGTTTLTSDMYYGTLVVDPGGVLNTANFRVFCRTSAVVNGAIRNNGGAASGATGGTATTDGTLGGARAGTTGTTGAGTQPSTVGTSLGSAGGGGGTGSGGAGGAGGAVGAPGATAGGTKVKNDPWSLARGSLLGSSMTRWFSGGGGGAGGGDGTNTGRGGGGGAGSIVILAPSITGSGTIEAKGGDGGATPTGNVGGGGGGGGGFVGIVTNAAITPTISVAGGIGSAGAGTGTAGTNGTAGTSSVVLMA